MKRSSAINNQGATKSPPTRGAWIETMPFMALSRLSIVAPHAGGVD